MGVRNASVSSKTIQNATVVTTTETVVATSPPINLTLDSALVLIFWEVIVTTGAGTTVLNCQIKRGTTTSGALVNVGQSVNAAASSTTRQTGAYFDTPGIVAGQQYSLTLQQGGATGNATVADVAITAIVL